jgi:hypothetical protein
MGTRRPFPGGKAWLGCDADHSAPSSAEVKNERELYLLSPTAPPWHVAGSLYLLYDQVFVTCILKFNTGTMRGPADISVFSFSPHIVKQVEGNCSHCISYTLSKFWQSSSQWWHVHSILDVPPKEKSRVRSGKHDDLVIGLPLPIHSSGNLQFKKSVTSL